MVHIKFSCVCVSMVHLAQVKVNVTYYITYVPTIYMLGPFQICHSTLYVGMVQTYMYIVYVRQPDVISSLAFWHTYITMITFPVNRYDTYVSLEPNRVDVLCAIKAIDADRA